MKFNILKNEVNISWDHIWITFITALVISVLGMTIVVIYTLAFDGTGTEFMEKIVNNQIAFATVFAYISLPISAFVLFQIARDFKMEKNESLCRSLAVIHFLIFGIGMTMIGIIAYMITSFNISKIDNLIVGYIIPILFAALNSFLLYLWLLILIRIDIEKLKKISIWAVGYAIASFIVMQFITFIKFTILLQL